MTTCKECGSIMTLRGSWHCANCAAVEPAGPCKCGSPAEAWWLGEGSALDLAHGAGEPRCRRCCLVDQLAYARAQADRIPALEAELKAIEPPHWLDRPGAPEMRRVDAAEPGTPHDPLPT